MRFDVEASLTYDFASPCEVLLLIEAAHGPDQTVCSEALTFWPNVDAVRVDDPVTFERRAVFTASGRVNALYRAQVEVKPRSHDLDDALAMAIRDLPSAVLPFLRPSRYSPSDRLERFVEHRFGGLKGGRRVAAILAWIAENLVYRAGVSDAATTAVDTLVDRAGVCRDFTHLVIGLCRASDIPARAVSAYAWKLEPPDLHAIAEVYLGGRWRLIDATGLAPIDGLVRVATGRDAADIAFMTIFGEATLVEQSFSIQAV
uniref:transglutaminase-like domain-containing protein n=1 Tax=uncultured Caulobacter sp. TaxID=158749 RepID=UPI0025F06831|nr:transglutaminase family protein [uncultured Caulobacter sp.]